MKTTCKALGDCSTFDRGVSQHLTSDNNEIMASNPPTTNTDTATGRADAVSQHLTSDNNEITASNPPTRNPAKGTGRGREILESILTPEQMAILDRRRCRCMKTTCKALGDCSTFDRSF